MKLFTRYQRINLLFMVLFFLLSSLAYYFLMNYLLLQELDLNLSKVESRLRSYVQQNKALPMEQFLDDLRISYVHTDHPGVDRSFELIAPTGRPGMNPHSLRVLNFFLELDHKWYQVIIARNLEGTNSFAKLVLKASMVTILVVILASLLVNRLLLKRLWKPFYASITALHNFQLGKNLRLRLPRANIDEFDFLNANLEQMTGRAERDYSILKEFTENASHEMQTPLAIIRSKLDLAIQDARLSEGQSANLRCAYAAIRKLSGLNRSLLLIARIENNQYAELVSVDLKARLEDKILQFRELWGNKIGITHRLDNACLYVNSDLVDILLNNLFSNACKHNTRNGTIDIQLRSGSLTVCNTGQASPLDAARLFTRFYKESGGDENNGLGLSIVKQICEVSGITASYSFSDGRHRFALEWR
jgi:signal transduction histidine kinase